MDLPGVTWIRRREGAREEQSRVFTEHVRALEGGAPLSERQIEEVGLALAAALRSEIKRRGLWESPPAYLGVYGWERWGPAGRSPLASGEEGALEELTAECYSYVFVSRLRSLEAQRKIKPNIDGLVFLNIRHFLHERQKEHDPIGAQVFAVLQAAVRKGVEAGDLVVLAGDARIRNDTVLGLAPGARAPAGREVVSPLAVRWNDDLLPDLLTSRGRRQEEVVQRMHGHLLGLRQQGIGALRFKDLVDPLKADVRARWAALLDRSQGDLALQRRRREGMEEVDTVRLAQPDSRFEERQVFRKLVACVLAALERLETNDKTRAYLMTLWQFVRIQSSEGTEASPGSLQESVSELAGGDEDHPSLRSLAEQLRIPRERLPGLYRTLGEMLERCRAAISGETAVKSLQRGSGSEARRPRFNEH